MLLCVCRSSFRISERRLLRCMNLWEVASIRIFSRTLHKIDARVLCWTSLEGCARVVRLLDLSALLSETCAQTLLERTKANMSAAFKRVYPYANVAYELFLLSYNVRYIFDHTPYWRPWLSWMGVEVRRMSADDYVRTEQGGSAAGDLSRHSPNSHSAPRMPRQRRYYLHRCGGTTTLASRRPTRRSCGAHSSSSHSFHSRRSNSSCQQASSSSASWNGGTHQKAATDG